MASEGYENQMGNLQCGKKEDLAQCLAGGVSGRVSGICGHSRTGASSGAGAQRDFLWIYGCVLSSVERCENPLKQRGATVSLHGNIQRQQKIDTAGGLLCGIAYIVLGQKNRKMEEDT